MLMARLVPEDYPLDEIASDTERAVVEALLDLADSWFIIPTVVDYGVDRELDIVLLHPAMGVVLVEIRVIPVVRAKTWRGDDCLRSPFETLHQFLCTTQTVAFDH